MYQILNRVYTKGVVVEERIDGSMFIKHKGTVLKFKEILARPQKDKPMETKILKPRKKYIPPKDHPWRKYPIFNKQKRTFLNV
jgi:hypothetical protein